jgi:hypothetical protein
MAFEPRPISMFIFMLINYVSFIDLCGLPFIHLIVSKLCVRSVSGYSGIRRENKIPD